MGTQYLTQYEGGQTPDHISSIAPRIFTTTGRNGDLFGVSTKYTTDPLSYWSDSQSQVKLEV